MINNVRYNVTCDVCNMSIPADDSYEFKVGHDDFGYDTICTVCNTCKEKMIPKLFELFNIKKEEKAENE